MNNYNVSNAANESNAAKHNKTLPNYNIEKIEIWTNRIEQIVTEEKRV